MKIFIRLIGVLLLVNSFGAAAQELSGETYNHMSVLTDATPTNRIPIWTKNYDKLVRLLQKTANVGNCSVSLSTDPNSPKGSFEINFLQNHGGLSSFEVDPPGIENGETQVSAIRNHVLIYRQSDFVGWTNMIVQLDAKEESILSIHLNKTLPSGKIYNKGTSCQ